MTQYINKETGEVYNDRHIKVGEDFIINPSEETLLEHGYEAHNVTQAHIFTVKQLASVEEVEKYDHTKNYPPKLNLKTT